MYRVSQRNLRCAYEDLFNNLNCSKSKDLFNSLIVSKGPTTISVDIRAIPNPRVQEFSIQEFNKSTFKNLMIFE
ncbi:hypothetical protein X777_07974 [Ooceraea biroi]|uniref:Uncharacterized protein n=1 Tax=Ooceraea biroi TaxID=2015173 RepID=A0A026W9Y0_OOCBI|nr:hypothetical protein X777_07974 [Ooceraea biroi]